MKLFIKTLKWIGLVLGTLALVLLAANLIMNIVFGWQLRRTLRDLKARGVPLNIEEITPRAIPDAENAAIPLKEAFILLANPETADLLILADIATTNVLTGKTPKTIAEWTEEQKEQALKILQSEAMIDLYALMETVAQRPGFNNYLDYTEGPGAILPNYGVFLTIVRLLDVKAGFEAESGEIDKALDTIRLGLRTNVKLAEEPILINQLVRIAADWIYIKRLENLAGVHALPYEQTLAIIKELARGADVSWEHTWNMDRLGIGLWIYDKLAKGRLEAYSGFSRIDNRILAALSPWLLGPTLKKDMIVYLDHMDEIQRRSSSPFYLVADEVQNNPVKAQMPWYAFIARLILDGYDRSIERTAEHQAGSAVAQVGLALNLFKRQYGAFPEKLAELEPKFFDVVPEDPFTGKALVYRKDGDGFILYSLGRNRKDNDGTPRDPGKNRDKQDYDIVWILPSP